MTSLRFAEPQWLVLLLLAPLIAMAVRKRVQAHALPHPDLSRLTVLTPDSARVRWARRLHWLRVLALILCLTALLRPQWGFEAILTHREGIAITMVVDVSSSMGARDLMLDEQHEDRLAVVKRAFTDFVSGNETTLPGRTGDAVGLLTFARYSDLRSPPTLDHPALVRLLEQVRIVNLSEEDGTAIGDAILAA